MLLLLSACSPPPFLTDSGELEVHDDEVVDLVADDGGPSPFLQGTVLCPRIECTPDDCPSGEDEVLACFEQSFDGPVVPDEEECLAFPEPGTVDWWFTAQECPANAEGYVPTDDHVAIDVLAPEAVEGRLAMPLEEAAEESEDDPSARIEHPDDWRVPDGATWRIAEQAPFLLSPRLRTIDGGERVAWSNGSVGASAGTVVAGPVSSEVQLVLEQGDRADLTLHVGTSSVAVGSAEGVALSTIRDIEIAVVYSKLAGFTTPSAARAVIHDDDGELVMGAPVTWHIQALRATPGPSASVPGADYVTFSDVCTDPATTVGPQRARLTASVDGHTASKVLTWTPRAQPEPIDGWTRDPECEGPCGCDTGGTSNAGAAAILLAAAVFRRRPR